jgi:hypothetical protein
MSGFRKDYTYCFCFDGELLFHNGCRPLILTHVFDTVDRTEIFRRLFLEEEGKLACNMFAYVLEQAEDGCAVLGYKPKDEEKMPNAKFVEYYINAGEEQFFTDVENTWKNAEIDSFAFIPGNDATQLLNVLRHCGDDEAVFDCTDDQLDPPKKRRKA